MYRNELNYNHSPDAIKKANEKWLNDKPKKKKDESRKWGNGSFQYDYLPIEEDDIEEILSRLT